MLRMAIVMGMVCVGIVGCAAEPDQGGDVARIADVQQDSLCSDAWDLLAGVTCGAVEAACDVSEVVTIGETAIPCEVAKPAVCGGAAALSSAGSRTCPQ